jgi:hypothetical protein
MHRKLLAAAALAVVALVTFVLIDPAEAASWSLSQIRTRFNPGGTAFSNAAVAIDTTSYAANEPAIQVGSGSTTRFSVDEDGDAVCVALTASGALTQSGQATFSANPSDTTAANSSVVITVSAHAANEKALAVGSVATIDKEGDAVCNDLAPTGRVDLAAHANSVGFNLPTFAGACLAVTGTVEGDLCWDSTNDALYAYNGAAYGTLGTASYSLTGQSLPTYDPAGTAATDAAIYFDTTGYENTDKAIAVGSVWSVDENGLTLTAAVTATGAVQGATLVGTTSATVPVGGLILGATAVDADADEIDKLDGLATTEAELATLNLAPLGTHTISCADDAAGTTSLCTIQLKNAAGADMAVRSAVFIYLSDDANGDSIVGTAPSGGWAITTDGLLISQVTNKAATFISESDGDIDFTITEAGALTIYVILVDSSGRLIASSALVFDA